MTSLIGHSCLATTASSFLPDGQIVVRAMIPIPKGVWLSINHLYHKLKIFWDTLPRRIELEISAVALCRCERCTDSTELGTFLGGMYCSDCPNNQANKGVLLRVDPLDHGSDWSCIKKCPARKTMKGYVGKLLTELTTVFD